MIRVAVAAASAAAILMLAPSLGHAIDRPCPAGKEWNVAKKSCVKKAVPKKSAGRKFREAVRHLEGKVRRPKPAHALKLLGEACNARHADSCTLLGFLHRYGRQAERSAQKSLDFYNRACKLKDAPGCIGAAEIHSDGLLGKTSHEKAIPLYDRGCTLGSGRACFELGLKYRRALGVKADRPRSKRLFTQAHKLASEACDKRKSGNDCYVVGRLNAGYYITGGSGKKAFTAYKKGCDAGSGDACRYLGAAHRYGRSTPKDPQKAYEQYKRGCDQYDDAVSCNDTGWLLLSWKATERDNKELVRVAKRACQLDQRYCAVLGNLHNYGYGLRKNARMATQMYLQACANGNAQSCSVAAYRAVAGNGMPKNKNRAIGLWRRGCNMSWGDACLQLGKKYETGEGVRKNAVTAYNHFYHSCIRDSGEGCRRAGELALKGKHGKRADAKLALSYFDSGCSDKDGESCIRASELLLAGGAVKKDVVKASSKLYSGCRTAKLQKACRQHGRLYTTGTHTRVDRVRGVKSFIEGCKLGDNQACLWIDPTLKEANAPARAKSEAVRGLTAACDNGVATACVVLGRLYAYGGYITAADPKKGVEIFTKRCDRGDGDACVQVGWMYAEGRGVVRDTRRAADIFQKQCDKNTAGACVALGQQKWANKEFAASVRLYNRACNEGDGNACNGAAFAYYTGRGVTWSPQKAAELYRQACTKGSVVGCSNVGELLWHGIGAKQNRLESFDYYQKGCTPDQPSGCTWVGRAYHLGEIVKRDVAKAEENYLRTCQMSGEESVWDSAESCMFLAELYEQTGKKPRSVIAGLRQRALGLAQKNAVDNPYGSWVLGKLHLAGVGTAKSKEKALVEFAKGCEGYDANACLAAGKLRIGDPATNPLADADKARAHLERACAAGLEEACELEANPTTTTTPVTPPKGPAPVKKRGSCACQGGFTTTGGTSGFAVLAALGWLGVTARRRRRHRHRP